jgi:hypothetical protein
MSHEELVEAVARRMERHMFADHELPITDKLLHARYVDMARAVIELIEAAIRAEEREACAKMVEESAGCVVNHPWGKAREVAAAIRARGEGAEG